MLLFRYDIRGLLNKDIYPELIDYLIDLFLKKTRTERVLLACDFNKKNLIIKNYLIKRYSSIFEDLQILPSPVFYFYVIKRKIPGIMITASHLKFNYVGLKFVLQDGTNWKPYRLKKIINRSKFEKSFSRLSLNRSLVEEYFIELKKHLSRSKKLFVQFDSHNYFLKKIHSYFRTLNLFSKKGAIFFITSDGDNDRIKIYYKNKEILPDLIFFLLAREKKYKRLGVPIYFSKFLENELRKLKKRIFYIPTGHINFKKAYRKLDLDIAFEPSGHFYLFRDIKTEAPYLALVKFLNLWNEEIIRLSRNIKIKRFSVKLDKIKDLNMIINRLLEKFDLNVRRFDGFYLFNQNRKVFVHLRQSFTENVLRVTIESSQPTVLVKEIRDATAGNS